VVTPEGSGGLVEPVVGQLHGVGDGVCWAPVGDGSGDWRHGLAGQVERDVPVERAVVGLEHRLQLAEELVEVGHALPAQAAHGAAEELLEGRALERVLGLFGLVCHDLNRTRVPAGSVLLRANSGRVRTASG
jgi:hypothetical protein